MIVTVTLNPSLDRTLSVPQLQPGTIHRAQLLRQDWGGKGINVSRALRALDIPSQLVGFFGGSTGQALQSGLLAAGFDVHFIDVGGETRQNLTLLDEASGQCTKINEPGPPIGPQHVAALQALVEQMARPGDLWAFCGSLPPGAPSDLYAQLIRAVQGRGGRAFLDSSGPAFRAGLAARPFAVKPNSEEAAEFLQYPLRDDADHCVAARRLQAEGITLVALSRGAQGLVLALGGDVVIAKPPPVGVRSPIGAGDAALAGLLWAVSDGCNAVETARRAAACGTAAAMQEGTAVGDRDLITKLLSQVDVATTGSPMPASNHPSKLAG
jgi:1-phosphofructokinase family hexose kinase